eukprot:253541-Pyramimonas_sp.AAC.2
MRFKARLAAYQLSQGSQSSRSMRYKARLDQPKRISYTRVSFVINAQPSHKPIQPKNYNTAFGHAVALIGRARTMCEFHSLCQKTATHPVVQEDLCVPHRPLEVRKNSDTPYVTRYEHMRGIG